MNTQENELTAANLVALGQNMMIVLNPGSTHVDYSTYSEAVRQAIQILNKSHFSASRGELEHLGKHEIPFFQNGTISSTAQEQLKLNATTILNTLMGESAVRIIVQNSDVPLELMDLSGLKDYQEALRQDLIILLQAGIARPAIVMAWALGFDIVRTWIYDDQQRLLAFNNQLKASPRKGEPGEVVDYRDFFRIKESRVLEICKNAQNALATFGDLQYRKLQGQLDDRNEFAHANFQQASQDEAKAFVEKLLRLLSSSTFD